MSGIPGQPAPSPADLPDKPGANLAAYATPPTPNTSTNKPGSALAAYASTPAPPPEPSTTDQMLHAGGQALDTAGRILDYPGGLVRAGVTGAVTGLTGNEVVTAEDLKNAAIGRGPGMAEYLRRIGVPEGASMKIGNTTLSMRGAEGFALDLMSDPLTVLTKAFKEMPILQKLVNVPGAASEALGEAVYKSAASSVENRMVKKGKIAAGETPIGDALVESGAPIGGVASLEKRVQDISSVMGKTRQAIYDKATQLGGVITGADMKFPNAEGVLNDIRSTPHLAPAAEELERDMLMPYKNQQLATLEQMSSWKSTLYKSLPQNMYDGVGRVRSDAQQLRAAMALDMKNMIEATGNKIEPGMGDAIEKLNAKWSPLLDANKPAMWPSGAAGPAGTTIDHALLAVAGIKKTVIKKALDLAVTPAARTAIGRALMEAGKRDLANRVVRQSLASGHKPDSSDAANPVPAPDPNAGQGQ